jgi:hypothetical protein
MAAVRGTVSGNLQIVVRRSQAVLDLCASGKGCGSDRISKSMHERAQVLLLGFIAPRSIVPAKVSSGLGACHPTRRF